MRAISLLLITIAIALLSSTLSGSLESVEEGLASIDGLTSLSSHHTHTEDTDTEHTIVVVGGATNASTASPLPIAIANTVGSQAAEAVGDTLDSLSFQHVIAEFGLNIGKHVRRRVLMHLSQVPGLQSIDTLRDIVASRESIFQKTTALSEANNTYNDGQTARNSLLLSFGNASLSRALLNQTLLRRLPAESFSLALYRLQDYGPSVYALVSDGQPLSTEIHRNISFDAHAVHYGALVGAYAALESLGFAFLHPLEPYRPPALRLSLREMLGEDVWREEIAPSWQPASSSLGKEKKRRQKVHGEREEMQRRVRWQWERETVGEIESEKDALQFASLTVEEWPRWPERAFHLHTQHPLELTEVLQGHDVPREGPHGPHCQRFAKRRYRPKKKKTATNKHTFSVSDVTKEEDGLTQGVKKGENEDGDEASLYCERWEDMAIDVDFFFEWSVANRVNQVEWLLLHSPRWGENEVGNTRHARLKKLTELGHFYSLLIGADVPLGNKQQHGWYMVNVRLPIAEQHQQIRDRIDYIFSANFDVITTESGLSEFTHPECDLMLELLNEFAAYANDSWGRGTGVKVHCSTGQRCSSFLDKRTGDPVNFNFLPSFAHPSLAVFPHTVQVYAFDDPTAGTYGNDNFRYMEDYLVFEAKQKQRAVLFYGETAYWVNYDIDVPLFLPIYGQRRQKDLRKIALREETEGFHMHGQLNFDSGWEWGYWLNDVITARSAWDPNIGKNEIESFRRCGEKKEKSETGVCENNRNIDDEDDEDEDCLALQDKPSLFGSEDKLRTSAEIPSGQKANNNNTSPDNNKNDIYSCPPHSDEWQIFSYSLSVFTRIYGPRFSQRLRDLLVSISQQQIELLILGRVHGRESVTLKKLSGIAYLCGTDTWVDLPRLFKLAFTQPDKVHFDENDDPLWPYVIELLSEMDRVFSELSHEMDSLFAEIVAAHQSILIEDFAINNQAIAFLREIQQATRMLALRAKQVKLLYESRDAQVEDDKDFQQTLQREARDAISTATEIVRARETEYRTHWRRIAAWRENPTVYRYGYLWSVHSLYNWWRDQGVAERVSMRSEFSPCYLNRMDSTEVAIGWGKYTLEWLRHFVVNYTPFASWYPLEVVNCLTPSTSHEYEFPRDL